MDLSLLFPQFEKPLIEFLQRSSVIKEFPAGTEIMRTGQYIKQMVLVLEGQIKLYREGEDGGELFMYFLEPGQACALSMMCAIRQETSSITAIATEDTRVMLVPILLMETLMKDYRTWYAFVIDNYRSRFEELLLVLDHVIFKGMDERLAFYLQNQAENLNSNTINITHQEIARDLNSSREVISRLLKKMEQQGKVLLNRNAITLL